MKPKKNELRKMYFIEEDGKHFYVFYVQLGPVKTLFDVKSTREEAEQAIREHKEGRHPTQWKPEN
jgi:hypothetical protein